MKLAACIIGFFFYTCANGKKIKIQIDTDDIVRMMSGLMNYDTFNKFTNQIVHRAVAASGGYGNPYHPEDDLVDRFDAAMDKQKLNNKNKSKINNEKDPLDKENDNFILDSEGTSQDELTENESSKQSMPENNIIEPYKAEERDDTNKENINIKIKANKTAELSSNKKDITVGDKSNFKPLQKRFLLKNSDGN